MKFDGNLKKLLSLDPKKLTPKPSWYLDREAKQKLVEN
jgi:hypothetical protein